ncbi:MAG: redox-sensing transcriptional repressor Rex [Bacteroidales bacterium]|nr:redox-sensing transcriptional repressor Rex [Bacteroidales bacterium]
MTKKDLHRKRPRTEIPEPTLRRLPRYLHFLQGIWEQGQMNISAPAIARELNYDPTQIVKDLSYTGAVGKPRVGYVTYELIRIIEDFLSLNTKSEAILVGAGNLGSALLSYDNLSGFGIKIIAAFDVAPTKVGTQIGNVSVMHVSRLNELVTRLKVEIGILTTPARIAQEAVDIMVDAKIKAIWNFTPTFLQVPDSVVVQNTSMYANVAILLQRLKELKNKQYGQI